MDSSDTNTTPAKPWVEALARVGYGTKGILYLLLGGLAVAAAVGAGGEVTGSKGVLRTVAQQPFGKFLLTAIAVGLAGYALWRAIQAALDPEHGEVDGERVAKRVGYGVSAILHGFLTYEAVSIAWLAGSGGGSKRSLLARVLSEGWGQWLVGAVGVAIVLFALTQMWQAWSANFMDKFEGLDGQKRKWVERAGRVGYGARALVFVIIAGMSIYAAVSANPSQAKSTGGALRELAGAPFGAILLGLVAAGLAIYGLQQLLKARWRSIEA